MLRQVLTLFFTLVFYTYSFDIYANNGLEINKSSTKFIHGKKSLGEVQVSTAEYSNLFKGYNLTKLSSETELCKRSHQIQNTPFSKPKIHSNVIYSTKEMVQFNYQKHTFLGVNEHILQPEYNKKYGFYTGVGIGKVFSDNSGVFLDGIKEIGKQVNALLAKKDGYLPVIVKMFIDKQITNIGQFSGKISFQWVGEASLGYHAEKNGRFDFEVMYSKINIEDGGSSSVLDKSASIFALLLNLYYSPSIENTKFTPYVGFGIGPTVFRLKLKVPPQVSMPLNVPWYAYQVKLGVEYAIMPEMDFFVGYRYFSMPIPIAEDITTHSVKFGLRFNF